MLEGVVAHDADGKVVQFNPAALRILGLTADQLLGKTAFDPKWKCFNEDLTPCPPEDHPSVKARLTGKPQINQVLGVQNSKGELRWVRVSAVPLFQPSGARPYLILITFHDFTDEKMAQTLLRKKEEELRRIVDRLPAMIGYWDHDCKNRLANHIYSEYFGLSPEEIRGRHIRDVLGPTLFEKNRSYIEAVLRGEPQTFEREIPLPKGGSRHTIATYLPDEVAGEVHGFFVIVTDISRIKELEAERRQMETTLIQASKMSSLGEIAGGVAHEINTPLATLTMATGSLKERILDDSLDKTTAYLDLEKMEKVIARIADIVRHLRAFARDGENQPQQPLQVSKMIFAIRSLCEQRFLNRGIDFQVSVIPESLFILGQEASLLQMLMNLLVNAFDALEDDANGKRKGWIRLDVESAGEKLSISVTDSGPGIPIHLRDKVMQPFFSTKAVGKGSGLGLSTSLGIAKSHGGDLILDENSPHTRFVVVLPRHQPSG